MWQFSIFDGDPNGTVYKNYTNSIFVPNFSHHKLTVFEYADGVNSVNINDTFQNYSTTRTDLDMYYEKVGLVYGQSSGRAIEPDYPSNGLDIQPKIDEFRIVGSIGEEVGISSIKAGDGVLADTEITVTTTTAASGLEVDTPFRITGITATGYSGQFVVSEKLSSTEIKYQVQNAPDNPLPTVIGSKLTLSSDTVTSASPYIFNISLRSVLVCAVCWRMVQRQLDLDQWLSPNILALDFRKMIMHLSNIMKVLLQLDNMMIKILRAMKQSAMTLEQDINHPTKTSMLR